MNQFKNSSPGAEDFAFRISDTTAEFKLTAKAKDGVTAHFHEIKECFLVTETYVHSWADAKGELMKIVITAHENNTKETHTYMHGEANPYLAETALFLDIHPAKLVSDPTAAKNYLNLLGVEDGHIAMYQDLGMSPEDTAKAIRMQQKMAESGQDDAQASTDYLADMSGYEFTMNDEGMSL